MALVATGARVHGGDQLKGRRIAGATIRAGDVDLAGFQRFAQGLKHTSIKFRELIEKQHAAGGEGDLSRHGLTATANHGRWRGAMVGCAKGSFAKMCRLENTR